jgi:hypothetical protein
MGGRGERRRGCVSAWEVGLPEEGGCVGLLLPCAVLVWGLAGSCKVREEGKVRRSGGRGGGGDGIWPGHLPRLPYPSL